MSPVLKAKGKDGCEADTKSAFENLSTLALFRRADPVPCLGVLLRLLYLTLCALHSKPERLVYIKQLIYVSILAGRTRR